VKLVAELLGGALAVEASTDEDKGVTTSEPEVPFQAGGSSGARSASADEREPDEAAGRERFGRWASDLPLVDDRSPSVSIASDGQAIGDRGQQLPVSPVAQWGRPLSVPAPDPHPAATQPIDEAVDAPRTWEAPDRGVTPSPTPADRGQRVGAHSPVVAGTGPHPAAELPLPRIVAIANQKGGVGKTTTAVNLSAALAELGYRVLVIDLDPQGNATTGLGINARNLEASIYDVLMHDLPLEECIEPTTLRNLFVGPATIDLAGAEIELVPAFSRELKLRRALAALGDDFDFTVIDCPPSLGLLTVNGLAAATEVLVPIQCEYYALEGLSQLLRNVNLVQGHLNPTLLISAVVLTMFDARTKLSEQVMFEVRDHFGPRVCRTIVPRTVRLSEAPSFGQPITVFDSSSRGALAYRELAREVSGGAPQRVG
jgi:chromosome partitioning protein